MAEMYIPIETRRQNMFIDALNRVYLLMDRKNGRCRNWHLKSGILTCLRKGCL